VEVAGDGAEGEPAAPVRVVADAVLPAGGPVDEEVRGDRDAGTLAPPGTSITETNWSSGFADVTTAPSANLVPFAVFTATSARPSLSRS
jgi:hypothetical protein